jgi:hypothetical protein
MAEDELKVEQDPSDPGEWIAYQLAAPVVSDGQFITVTSGGGGLSMRINKCNGTVTDIHWQR